MRKHKYVRYIIKVNKKNGYLTQEGFTNEAKTKIRFDYSCKTDCYSIVAFSTHRKAVEFIKDNKDELKKYFEDSSYSIYKTSIKEHKQITL